MRSINFIVSLAVYPFDVMVSFGQSDKDLEEEFIRLGTDYKDTGWEFENTGVGRTIVLPSGQTLLRLATYPESCIDYNTLAHEIFHSVQFLMQRLQMPLNMDTCEAYAYLIGYLTEKIYEKI